LLHEDGSIYLIVVEHEEVDGVYVRHKAYELDENMNQVGESFVVTYSDEYGEGADHRTAIIDDELVVVYQTLIASDEPVDEDSKGSEGNAESQSLILKRFSLEDGTELDSNPIVAFETDFEKNNFPDHSLLWNAEKERLLVSTGTYGPATTVNIREVELDGDIISTYSYDTHEDDVGSKIGNSMFWSPEEELLFFNYVGNMNEEDLQITTLDELYSITDSVVFEKDGTEEVFPIGVFYYEGLYFVGYISRPEGDSDMETNPYHPHLMVLNENFEIIEDFQVSEENGSGHLHPTMIIVDDTLYFAWSKSTEQTNGLNTPQVQIEEFSLSF